jgi:SET domain-containing protein
MPNDQITAPVLIEIKPSLMLKGEIGLFAARDLAQDTIIAEASKLGEHFITWDEVEKLDPITREKTTHYCLDTEQGIYLPDDFNYLTVPWNMNHSCDYKVGFDEVGNFVTAKAVKKGEELTWDYGMGRSNPRFVLVCQCGSEKCRKMITGNDWKNTEYREANKKYFLRELLAQVNS